MGAPPLGWFMTYSWRDVEEVDVIQLAGMDCEEVSS